MGAGKYIQLAKIRILHHFWLNNGSTHFNSLSATDQEKALKDYKINQVFHIEPTPESHRLLAGRKLMYLQSPDGFIFFAL